MTTPYRIVWHTGNPWNGEWLPRPGEKCDMITVQRLALQDPASIPDDRPTHVIYVNYGVWYAEITCKFSASRDQLGQFRLRTCNPTLRGAIGSPEEIYFAMFEEVATPVPAHSPEEREVSTLFLAHYQLRNHDLAVKRLWESSIFLTSNELSRIGMTYSLAMLTPILPRQSSSP